MDIYIGTSGIPASVRLKNGNVIDGLYALRSLSLNALEFDFVNRIYLSNDQCKVIARIADMLKIRLSIHAPYYINLLSEKASIVEASKRRILACVERACNLNADAIAVHIAYYGKLSKEEAYRRVKRELASIISEMKERGLNARIGIETMAKHSQFGTLDEVLLLHEELGEQVVPYIDFAHIFARNNGSIDYSYILDRLEKYDIKHINSHFEGLKRNKEGRYIDVHAPINTPPFEPLAVELINRKGSITIICESPLLELDCLKMKRIIDELKYSYK